VELIIKLTLTGFWHTRAETAPGKSIFTEFIKIGNCRKNNGRDEGDVCMLNITHDTVGDVNKTR